MRSDRGDRGIVVRANAARELMGAFRPTVCLVLLDVALDAEWDDGRLVAATSARLVAEHLRLDPGTTASALRVLRDAGLVELGQSSGPDGRFGLAAYTMRLPKGIETLVSKPASPCTVEPHTVIADTSGVDAGLVLSCPPDGEPARLNPSFPQVEARGQWAPPTRAASGSRPSCRSRAGRPEQGALDLGDGA